MCGYNELWRIHKTITTYERDDIEDLSNFGNLNNIASALMDIYGIEIFADTENNLLYTTEGEQTDKMNNRKNSTTLE